MTRMANFNIYHIEEYVSVNSVHVNDHYKDLAEHKNSIKSDIKVVSVIKAEVLYNSCDRKQSLHTFVKSDIEK